MNTIKRDINGRFKLVDAMNTVVKAINCEDIIELWLTNGVADGDSDEALLDYTDDQTFEELMTLFLRLMRYAYKDGGLYYNGVKSFSVDDCRK